MLIKWRGSTRWHGLARRQSPFEPMRLADTYSKRSPTGMSHLTANRQRPKLGWGKNFRLATTTSTTTTRRGQRMGTPTGNQKIQAELQALSGQVSPSWAQGAIESSGPLSIGRRSGWPEWKMVTGLHCGRDVMGGLRGLLHASTSWSAVSFDVSAHPHSPGTVRSTRYLRYSSRIWISFQCLTGHYLPSFITPPHALRYAKELNGKERPESRSVAQRREKTHLGSISACGALCTYLPCPYLRYR